MTVYQLMTGETLDLSGLTEEDRVFLLGLSKERAADYFDLLRRVKGPDARPLRGGPITPAIAASLLYRAAHDTADRVGIEQGYLLPIGTSTVDQEASGDLLSLTEAAELIGISRPSTHEALTTKRLPGRRVGNAWVIRRRDAEAFRDRRSGPGTSQIQERIRDLAARGARR